MIENIVVKRNDDLFAGIMEHEIVKYNPLYYNKKGAYTKEDWTDVSDIGKKINGRIVSIQEYLEIEDKYIAVAGQVMAQSHCSYLTVVLSSTCQGFIHNLDYHNPLRDNNLQILNGLPAIHNGMRISTANSLCLLRLIIRNIVDGILINLSRDVEINMGWDYYMHIRSPLDYLQLKDIVNNNGLYLDPRSDIWKIANFKAINAFLDTFNDSKYRRIKLNETWIDSYNNLLYTCMEPSSLVFCIMEYCYEWLKHHKPNSRIALHLPIHERLAFSAEENIIETISRRTDILNNASLFVFKRFNSLPFSSIKFESSLSTRIFWKVYSLNDAIIFSS